MPTTEIIKLKFGIAGLKNPEGKWIIPPHLKGELTCDIADEVAVFSSTPDSRIAEILAKLEMAEEKKRGYMDTVWLEREKKAVSRYAGRKKEQIRDLLLQQFKQMNVNAK